MLLLCGGGGGGCFFFGLGPFLCSLWLVQWVGGCFSMALCRLLPSARLGGELLCFACFAAVGAVETYWHIPSHPIHIYVFSRIVSCENSSKTLFSYLLKHDCVD
jgi:hypothetical protein